MAENNRGFPEPKPRPEIANMGSSKDSSTSIKTVVPTQSGIEVVALRAGYFNHARRSEGDKFTVPTMNHVGTWMRCVDAKAEAQHQETMKQQRAAVK